MVKLSSRNMDEEKEFQQQTMNHSFDEIEDAALYYHSYQKSGKLEIRATKPLDNQRDLALAYSPGVAAPCLEIQKDPNLAAQYTARSNLIGVISNGSAVLGLGNIGPLASKPVMEGKAVLFKKFAGIDVFDIEINASEISSMVETIAALEPTFGGMNLEDIKAPECFEVEEQLKKRLKIPVFHDDQHGTAIIVTAAILNALELGRKKIEEVKIVTSGAGAAALACLNLLVRLGAKKENIWVTDIEGVVYKGRQTLMDRWKETYVQDTKHRTLEDLLENADVFLGLSAGGVLKPEYLKKMAPNPLILALANPTPEIIPEIARKARPDAMICTGRSDYPNQVNNVLCFPYIFRGALDVGATAINEEMKMAAVYAIAQLAKEPITDSIRNASKKTAKQFGPDYLIPSPFDSRLIFWVAPAVAKAAMETKVATRILSDMNLYRDTLTRFVFRSGLFMKPIFATAKAASQKRVVYADGEDERVLRAAEVAIQEKIAEPILIGRHDVILRNIEQFGLRIRPNIDFELLDPENNPHYDRYTDHLIRYAGRRGVTPQDAKIIMRASHTAIAALAISHNHADAMICGLRGRFDRNLQYVKDLVGLKKDQNFLSSLNLLISQSDFLFFTDAFVNQNPSVDDLVEITTLACQELLNFGIEPKTAFLSHSNFGSKDSENAKKIRKAVQILNEKYPKLMIDGEMHGDSALSESLRTRVFPHSRLKGEANLLIFPDVDSAHITLNVTKQAKKALQIGPILLGTEKPAHILTSSVTARGIVNMTAIAVLEINKKLKPL